MEIDRNVLSIPVYLSRSNTLEDLVYTSATETQCGFLNNEALKNCLALAALESYIYQHS
jgi:hypothetical protein